MNRPSGFSLVEMLVAISIFSMLLSLLMLGYSQGLSLWQRGQDRSETWLSLEHRHQLLRTLFFGARFADYRGRGWRTYPYFIANQEGIEFMTRSPLLDFSGRVKPVRVLIERDDNDQAKFRYQEGRRHSDQGRGIYWDSGRSLLFMEEMRDAGFRYLAPAFPLPPDLYSAELSDEDRLRYRDEPEWLSWYDTAILWRAPLAVELSFRDEEGARHTWSFQVPGQADAWSLRGKIKGYD